MRKNENIKGMIKVVKKRSIMKKEKQSGMYLL